MSIGVLGCVSRRSTLVLPSSFLDCHKGGRCSVPISGRVVAPLRCLFGVEWHVALGTPPPSGIVLEPGTADQVRSTSATHDVLPCHPNGWPLLTTHLGPPAVLFRTSSTAGLLSPPSAALPFFTVPCRCMMSTVSMPVMTTTGSASTLVDVPASRFIPGPVLISGRLASFSRLALSALLGRFFFPLLASTLPLSSALYAVSLLFLLPSPGMYQLSKRLAASPFPRSGTEHVFESPRPILGVDSGLEFFGPGHSSYLSNRRRWHEHPGTQGRRAMYSATHHERFSDSKQGANDACLAFTQDRRHGL